MRRLLVVLVLLGLVITSAAVAVIASDWPFWQRAWRWHVAGPGGAEHLPGAWAWIEGRGGRPEPPPAADAPEARALADLAQRIPTRALLADQRGRLLAAEYGSGTHPGDLLQGGPLVPTILAPLYAAARRDGFDLLDTPLRSLVPEFGDDPRGEITPRQLLWEVSGLESPAWRPLDPFGARARLSAGPSFERAARSFRLIWPPGSHFEPSPANAQLAGVVLATARGRPLAQLLEAELWQPIGASRARVALDRLGGEMAAHCCLAATARDWLRVAALYAGDGRLDGRMLWPAGFTARDIARETAVHPGYGLGMEIETLADGTALLWAGAKDRMMLAVPSRGLSAVWFTSSPVGPADRAQLAAALGLGSPGVDP